MKSLLAQKTKKSFKLIWPFGGKTNKIKKGQTKITLVTSSINMLLVNHAQSGVRNVTALADGQDAAYGVASTLSGNMMRTAACCH